jgi:hypothetical protein
MGRRGSKVWTQKTLRCTVCGSEFPYRTIHHDDPAKLCGQESCYAETIMRYWESQNIPANVVFDHGKARLVSVSMLRGER